MVARWDGTGRVRAVAERLSFWPFRHEELSEELASVGLRPETTTYAADVDRYLATARRP
ncbi:hypothetical protein GCM10009557_92770 [Virgisporangium ochraceum]|uniref:Uncharacterized protein n=1 Tax=Virgisporangium ochraceum TaxID=65505 RepID=A0A8J4EFV6_9ACTN|nr:hypothetical protein [Virgisporangium ochraceum]GIJ73048.1 hypothetical protein Voc01_079650 [Virgisporangium ochraceum]